jgi:NTE family protein
LFFPESLDDSAGFRYSFAARKKTMAEMKRKRIGLALGGGGSRGFAHIGVLKILEENSIPIDVLAGTSIGALVGGAYASGLGPDELIRKLHEIIRSPLSQISVFKAIGDAPEKKEMGLADKIGLFFKSQWLFAQALFNPGMMNVEDVQAVINHFIPNIRIEETKIPFRAVTADLVSGRQVVLSTGSLRRAVMASCSVPGFMPPLKDGDSFLVDGGIVNLVPASVARQEGADIVIAVDVDLDINVNREFQNAIDVYTRAAEIGSFHLSSFQLKDADIVVRPMVGGMKWFDLSQVNETIHEGERSTKESMTDIRRFIPEPKKRTLLNTILDFFRTGKSGR